MAERLVATLQNAAGQNNNGGPASRTGSPPNGTANGTPPLPESAVKAIFDASERAERAER